MTSVSGAPSTFSLRRRLLRLAALFLLFIVLAGGVGVWSQQRWSSALQQRRTALLAMNDLTSVRLALGDQESGVRGYALSGEESFLEPYTTGQQRLSEALAALTNDDSDARSNEQITVIRDAAELWRTRVAEPMIAARRAGRPPNIADLESSRRQFEGLRTLLELESAQRQRLFESADAKAAASRSIAVGFTVGWLIVGLLIALFVLWAFRRWVFRPLGAIEAASIATEKGERVPFPRGASLELDTLANAVEQLHLALSTERDRAVRSYETLEQSAVLALHVRGALASDASFDFGDGWGSYTSYQPAAGAVAGDCYDVGLVRAGELYVMMVDVTGHGPVAALNALQAKTLLRTSLRGGRDPGSALREVYDEYVRRGELDYLTAFVALISTTSGKIRYANAGHPAAVLVHEHAGTDVLGATGPLLGPISARWHNAVALMERNDTLVIYTDGLTDTRNEARQPLGEEWLVGEARRQRMHPEGICAELVGKSAAHRFGAQEDDISIVVIHRGEAVPNDDDDSSDDTGDDASDDAVGEASDDAAGTAGGPSTTA